MSTVTESTSGSDHFLNFTISWENSWRVNSNPFNWDAVWIFVKRSDCANIQWHHADLSSVSADHTIGVPLQVQAYADKKGVMVYRSAAGAGNISNVNIQLKLDAPPAGTYQYKVFGIEMVYVPQGAFYAGDGASQYSFHDGDSNLPYLINNENAITVSGTTGGFFSGAIAGPSYVLPAAYPKGYNSFYCMKYEISQGQYADFLNTIKQDASQVRFDPLLISLNRYTISGVYSAFTAAAPDRACNFIGPQDLVAYLDWAALSPMTELEFEKACRGDLVNAPLAGEFAWGGTAVTRAATITPGTDGQPNETVDDIIPPNAGLANYNNSITLNGPLRCGFAARSGTDRRSAGATYYGIMEMSGNLYEICYNIDSAAKGFGYLFTGNHGDGELSVTPFPGYSNQGWPGLSVTDNQEEQTSFAVRGGSWGNTLSSDARQLAISDRSNFGISIVTVQPPINTQGRGASTGGRGVSRR